MATDIILYSYTGNPNVIDKSANRSAVTTMTGTFRDPLALMDPVFDIQGQDNFKENLVNYAVIDGKYYFITDYEIMPNNITKLSLHLDVLATYMPMILGMSVMLERSNAAGNNLYMVDGSRPISTQRNFTKIEFDEIDETEGQGAYVLVTSQSGYSPI